MPLYEFCIDGATLKCRYGSDTCEFKVPNLSRAKQGGKHVGTRVDKTAGVHIRGFGKCRLNNFAHFNNYDFSSPNDAFVPGKYIIYKSIEDVKINSSGKCIAKCFYEWMNVHNRVVTQDEPNLIFRPGDSSYTFCEYGGYVTFNTSGQKTPSDMTAEELFAYFALNCPGACPEEIHQAVKDFMTLNDYYSDNQSKLDAGIDLASEILNMPPEVAEAGVRLDNFNRDKGVYTPEEEAIYKKQQETLAGMGYDNPEAAKALREYYEAQKEYDKIKKERDVIQNTADIAEMPALMG